MNTPIIKGSFTLQKFAMKGGWTYVLLPPLPVKTGLPFGWIIVKGKIDDYEINQFKLWPTVEKKLFLPVKAEIRKKIKKSEGDVVHVILYEDKSAPYIPEEFELCLMDSPVAKLHFEALSPTSQKHYIDFIYGTKNPDTRIRRITKSIEKLEKNLK